MDINMAFLHGVLLFYSFTGVCSKLAAQQAFLSLPFMLLYSFLLFLMLIYAFLWQQVLKRISLTKAFGNKAITIIWGMLWGAFFFHEEITLQMMLGATIICVGIAMVVREDE